MVPDAECRVYARRKQKKKKKAETGRVTLLRWACISVVQPRGSVGQAGHRTSSPASIGGGQRGDRNSWGELGHTSDNCSQLVSV
jgi:hypothetical protein